MYINYRYYKRKHIVCGCMSVEERAWNGMFVPTTIANSIRTSDEIIKLGIFLKKKN